MSGVQGDLPMPPEPPESFNDRWAPAPPLIAGAQVLPTGAGADAGQPPPAGPQYDFSQGDALRKAAGDPLAQADAMSAERRAALNPLMNDVQQAGARQQQHSQARQQQLAHNPQSPEPQQGMGLEAAANWVMIATGIGALAGAMTRRSATNAMAAFTGALEGVAAGNKQAFEQNKTIWEQENKRINQQLEQQRDAYLDIMNSDKMDLNMKMLMLQQKAAELHDDQTMQLAARKDMELWAERADKLEIARQQGVIEFKKIDATLERYGGGKPTMSPEAIDIAARNYKKTGALPPNMGRGIQGSVNRDAILNAAADMGGGTAQEQAEYRASVKADSASLAKLVAQKDAVTAFENTAIRNGERLVELARKVDDTGVPAFQKWINAGKKATGDPDVAAFNFQYQAYVGEAARIVNNPNLSGVLTVTAKQDFMEAVPAASSAEQLATVFELAKKDFRTRAASLDEQIESVHGRLRGEEQKPGGQQPSGQQQQFSGRTASGPNGAKLRETTSGDWVP